MCKFFSKDLANRNENVPRHSVVPRSSDLEVIALSLTAVMESIDSENCLFEMLKSSRDKMPNQISRSQYNDRCK